MEENCPSRTALRVATRRAAHQVLDAPRIFDDPLALRVLGLDAESVYELDQKQQDATTFSRVLRASLAARSRYAEDELRLAIQQGVTQYVVLGAGLDTFAYRNPYPGKDLHVFEVDHPATQNWKRMRLKEAEISIPQTLSFVAVDFETQPLAEGLCRSGFDTNKRSFFSWLGVTMYLSDNAIRSTLQFVAKLPSGSEIVFDYMISPSILDPRARKAFDSLNYHVALAGEPFQTFFEPSLLQRRLLAMGFTEVEDIGPDQMDARYFQGRSDDLHVGRLAHIMNAKV